MLGLPIPDTELTRSFDAKLRKASLEDLLATCLAARTRDEPLVIVLEDCHWIDELSRDLLRLADPRRRKPPRAVRAGLSAGADAAAAASAWPSCRSSTRSRSTGWTRRTPRRWCAPKLEQVVGRGPAVSDELAALVTERAGGNPLYIEELISYIAGRGIDIADPAALAHLQLPESLHSIVLSRIDTVAEAPRRTLKVASVVGRVFRAPMLPGAYEELGSLDDVRGELEILRAVDLVGLDREEDLSYLFKHVVTQEVAYESMPFALRTVLHRRLADFIEASEPDAIDRNLDLLAHHYWHGDDDAKKREFLGLAAAAAGSKLRERSGDPVLRAAPHAARRPGAGRPDAAAR